MDDDHTSLYDRSLWPISDEPYRMIYPSAIRNLCQNEHTKE